MPKGIDILTYSFPCQDISQQGNQRGLNKNTRSGLLYEIERILTNNKDRLPKVLLLENVKALTSKKFIKQFNEWINILNTLGYKSEWKIINSIEFGSLQNRERVFCVSYLNDKHVFTWPKAIDKKKSLSKIFTSRNEMKSANHLLKYLNGAFSCTNNNIWKTKLIEYTNFNSEAYVYLPKGYGPTLTASGANSRLKFYFKDIEEIKFISPSQAFLYMGFDKKDYLIANKDNIISESKLIYLCGNSISIEVLEALFKQIIECQII
nr:DNA (cytosine-5-)-methyltransferase [Metamycoplasma auris]